MLNACTYSMISGSTERAIDRIVKEGIPYGWISKETPSEDIDELTPWRGCESLYPAFYGYDRLLLRDNQSRISWGCFNAPHIPVKVPVKVDSL